MTTFTATYSPEDNKLRLYASTRLDAETYSKVKSAGFIWAPKQELFVAPKWTPAREDLLIELAGEIEPEEMTLAERAALKAERLDNLAEKRRRDVARIVALRQRRALDKGALLAAGEFTRQLQERAEAAETRNKGLELRLAEAEKPRHVNDPDASLVAMVHEERARADRAEEQAKATVAQAIARVEALERLLFKSEPLEMTQDMEAGNVVQLRAAA